MAARTRGPRTERTGIVVHLDSVRLSEYDEDGFLGIQIDADGTIADGAPDLAAQTSTFEALHPYGFNSRPLDPQVDGNGQLSAGALSLTLWEGARAYSIALHDARVTPALARCKPGESVQYGCRNNFVRCHDDGRISAMCTTDGTEDGETIDSTVGPDGFSWRGPWGAMRHNEMGFWYRHASGARMELGGITGLLAPLDAVRNQFRLDADLITLTGLATLGIGTHMPAAKATPTVAADSALLTAVQALLSAVEALGAIAVNAAAGPAITAAAGVVATSASSVGTAALAIPAASVQVA